MSYSLKRAIEFSDYINDKIVEESDYEKDGCCYVCRECKRDVIYLSQQLIQTEKQVLYLKMRLLQYEIQDTRKFIQKINNDIFNLNYKIKRKY